MNIILLMTSLTLAFSFLMLSHPLSLGLILLLQTTTITFLTGMMTYNFWFSYILFIIMIGGMLILFIYMTSIASNEKFKLSIKLTFLLSLIMFIIISSFMLDTYLLNLNLNNNLIDQVNMTDFKFSLNKLLNWPLNMIFFFLIIYLLITLIMVVKITKIQYGPLRQKF